MNKSMIIIGGGIAGLAAGCYGRMNGYKTRIFEMHDSPGGVCTSWKRNGYTIDGCIHWLVGSNPNTSMHHLWEELGVIKGMKYINHEEFSRIEGSDGRVFIVYANLDRLEKHMKELAPEDAPVIEEFIGAARAFTGMDLPVEVISSPIEGLKVLLKMLPFLRWFLKWRGISINDYSRRFRNPFLKEAFLKAFAGEMDMPALAMLMTLSWLNNGTAGYPLGGSLEFSRAMERRYLGLDGEIAYRSRVAKILVENGRAVGVRLADGSEHRADWVISAADGHTTIFEMLEGKYAGKKIRGYYENFPLFQPLVYIGLGVNRAFDDFPSSVGGVNFPLAEPVHLGGKEITRLGVMIYNFDPSLAPPGKTILKVMFPVDYDWWKTLAQDPARYRAEKERIADQVAALLDRRFPGLAAQVEMRDVATPLTFERYTGNWRGSYEGWLMTTRTFGLQMPKNLPGLGNFYMAGQWVEPGGGVPTAAMSGRNAIRKICKKDGKRFKTFRDWSLPGAKESLT